MRIYPIYDPKARAIGPTLALSFPATAHLNKDIDTKRTATIRKNKRISAGGNMEEVLKKHDDKQLDEIIKQRFWTRTGLSKIIGINKSTMKPYCEELAIAVRDFRAHIPRTQIGDFQEGYSLTTYQAWVIAMIAKLMAEFKDNQNGKAYYADARRAIAASQDWLSYEEFRYRCNIIHSSRAA